MKEGMIGCIQAREYLQNSCSLFFSITQSWDNRSENRYAKQGWIKKYINGHPAPQFFLYPFFYPGMFRKNLSGVKNNVKNSLCGRYNRDSLLTFNEFFFDNFKKLLRTFFCTKN